MRKALRTMRSALSMKVFASAALVASAMLMLSMKPRP
jgi:hypothetical protein